MYEKAPIVRFNAAAIGAFFSIQSGITFEAQGKGRRANGGWAVRMYSLIKNENDSSLKIFAANI